MKVLALFATAAFIAAAGAASAQSASKADQNFVKQAAMGGMAEVAAGQIAAQKGGNDQVKQFGQKMATDHTKANDQLKQIAMTEGLQIPDSDPKADKETRKLDGLSGDKFDKQYTKMQLKDHETTIKLFEKEANSGKDPQLKQFAAQTLPILQDHLQMAQQMASAVGVKAPNS
jgi:putative membrane protein